jgi:hypothetical protein
LFVLQQRVVLRRSCVVRQASAKVRINNQKVAARALLSRPPSNDAAAASSSFLPSFFPLSTL